MVKTIAKCYRVETSDGSGMYSTYAIDGWTFSRNLNCLCWDLGHDHWNSDHCHPAPATDEKLKWREHSGKGWLFGFASMYQLNRWIFDIDVIQKMVEYDLAVSVYDCKEYSIGNTQMIFDKSKSKFIERFVLTP